SSSRAPSIAIGARVATAVMMRSDAAAGPAAVTAMSNAARKGLRRFRNTPSIEESHVLAESSDAGAFAFQVLRRFAPVAWRLAKGQDALAPPLLVPSPAFEARMRLAPRPCDQFFVPRHERQDFAALHLRQGPPALVVGAVARPPLPDWQRN